MSLDAANQPFGECDFVVVVAVLSFVLPVKSTYSAAYRILDARSSEVTVELRITIRQEMIDNEGSLLGYWLKKNGQLIIYSRWPTGGRFQINYF